MSEIDARVLYLNARERYTEARKAVYALQNIIEPVARTLEHSPARFVPKSDADIPSWERPMTLAGWPTAEVIIAAVTELDVAFKECNALWAGVPAERRGGMDEPPSRHGAL